MAASSRLRWSDLFSCWSGRCRRIENRHCVCLCQVRHFGLQTFLYLHFGTGGSTEAGQPLARPATNSEATVSFSRKCRSRKSNVQDLELNTGTLASSIIFSSPLRRVQLLAQRMHPCLPGGQKCSRWYKSFSR